MYAMMMAWHGEKSEVFLNKFLGLWLKTSRRLKQAPFLATIKIIKKAFFDQFWTLNNLGLFTLLKIHWFYIEALVNKVTMV